MTRSSPVLVQLSGISKWIASRACQLAVEAQKPLLAMVAALGLSAMVGSPAQAAPGKNTTKPAIVFMVAGQSNAGGCGCFSHALHEEWGRLEKWGALSPGSTAEENGLPFDPQSYPDTYIWLYGKGFAAYDPVNNSRPAEIRKKPQMHGIELPMAGELRKRFPENDIYILKRGISGANLRNDWNPERPDGHYATWLAAYREAMAELSSGYPEVRVVGLYWDQGESDKKATDVYADNLKNLIATFRRDSGLPELPFFIRKHIYDFVNTDKLVAAQEKVVKEDANCHMLDIDLGNPGKNYEEWSYKPKNIHLNSKAFIALNEQLFEKILVDPTLDSFLLYKPQ